MLYKGSAHIESSMQVYLSSDICQSEGINEQRPFYPAERDRTLFGNITSSKRQNKNATTYDQIKTKVMHRRTEY